MNFKRPPMDPEIADLTRWIVERNLHQPPEHEIERRPALELPLPPPGWKPTPKPDYREENERKVWR
jgi:hypothetical protein